MMVLLVLDRAKETSGLWAMLWTAVGDDPRLKDSVGAVVPGP